MVWHDLGLNRGLPDHWRTLYPLCVIFCKPFSSGKMNFISFIFFSGNYSLNDHTKNTILSFHVLILYPEMINDSLTENEHLFPQCLSLPLRTRFSQNAGGWRFYEQRNGSWIIDFAQLLWIHGNGCRQQSYSITWENPSSSDSWFQLKCWLKIKWNRSGVDLVFRAW